MKRASRLRDGSGPALLPSVFKHVYSSLATSSKHLRCSADNLADLAARWPEEGRSILASIRLVIDEIGDHVRQETDSEEAVEHAAAPTANTAGGLSHDASSPLEARPDFDELEVGGTANSQAKTRPFAP